MLILALLIICCRELLHLIFFQHFQAETTADGWMPADVASWRSAGFKVTAIDSKASFGRIHALQRKAGALIGSADPDWEGSALPERTCIADDS